MVWGFLVTDGRGNGKGGGGGRRGMRAEKWVGRSERRGRRGEELGRAELRDV